ncbi:polyadenylate-specific 3'-exoribonuclease AS [Corynebacterium aquilae]|uniref:3'-5' exoribonuclease n=1 Tax=Corynebacterium aquilae DSM 44791 TaxID=1431546 RepID=A0A1L7CGX1_9CORY|nr:polyadenylate-specific 3'-exoribonuclease AS [Corynebacterium aquilae]APT85111.1 hypothetical protein CAQU_08550 [Corynebacterium aquilae DSM 44791]
MRYFYDTEFIEDGTTIELVSIGIVAEDGREYYAVSTDFDAKKANSWVKTHVLNQLPSPADKAWRSKETIAREVKDFLTAKGRCELFAWVGSYDHVVLAQLYGAMPDMPKGLPHYTGELKQLWVLAGRPQLPPIPQGAHDALVDARHNKAKYEVISKTLNLRPDGTARTSRD